MLRPVLIARTAGALPGRLSGQPSPTRRATRHAGLLAASLALAAPLAQAAEPVATSAGMLLQVLAGLAIVIGLMAAAAWVVRQFGVNRLQPRGPVVLVGGVSVGSRERVMVVEVADQWIVIGVAGGSVTALATLPRQATARPTDSGIADSGAFADWLKRTMDRRNGQ